MELADRVKLKRKELEMSQDELASRMGKYKTLHPHQKRKARISDN